MPKPVEAVESARAYTVTEVAELMRCNRNYVYKLINSGRLRYLKLGSIRIPHEFLIDFYRNSEGIDLHDPLSKEDNNA